MAASTSKVDLAIESVVSLINGMNNFAAMTRGALGSSNGLVCEPAPSTADSTFLDKNRYIDMTLAINGKHSDLQTLTNTLNNIIDTLTRATSYPSGGGWEIVDIATGNYPRVIGRENNNAWVMACDVVVKIYRKDD